MAITAAMVKELREVTGAGMMDCKKALTETNGDMDAAVDFLREKGLAGAVKKEGRVAVEGLSYTKATDDAKKAVVVEVNIETDFAANTDKFKNYVNDVCDQAMATTATDIEGFLADKWVKDNSVTVEDARKAAVADISENISIRRFAVVEEANGFVATYIHAGGKIGVLVDVETDVINDAVKEMGKNVAMQVAALSPKYTRSSEISQEYIEKEKEIYLAEAKNEKPDA
ncbi:MAG: translation elongation factor Ts, partial [Lachnospiraceae bacterium]|nr:translation elongation factor Ts [Lachnospiraceae bacterium]